MSEAAFFRDEAKRQTREAVEAVESVTSAEIVVALRKSSGHYRHTDYLFGAVSAVATLTALLFLPWEFPLWSFVVDVAIAFGLGSLLCATWPTLRRFLTWPPSLRRNAEAAAKVAFYDLGISRTSARTGILVFVSMLERRVVVVPDIGVDLQALGAPWTETIAELEAALGLDPDIHRFTTALRKLGPVLAPALPRSEDDVNELPDEVAA